jgi:SOS response associated peptidase (SRAP)
MQAQPLSTPCLSDGKAIALRIPATKFHRAGLAPSTSANAGVEARHLRRPEGNCSYLQRRSARLPEAVLDPLRPYRPPPGERARDGCQTDPDVSIYALRMCGRVIQSSGPIRYAIVEGFDVRDSRLSNYPRRWNGAPNQELLVIRENHKTSERSLDLLRWGLIPHWCKDPTGGRKPINAKSETLEPDPHDLLVPFPSEPMTIWPISRRVNSPDNDDERLLEEISPPADIAV